MERKGISSSSSLAREREKPHSNSTHKEKKRGGKPKKKKGLHFLFFPGSEKKEKGFNTHLSGGKLFHVDEGGEKGKKKKEERLISSSMEKKKKGRYPICWGEKRRRVWVKPPCA